VSKRHNTRGISIWLFSEENYGKVKDLSTKHEVLSSVVQNEEEYMVMFIEGSLEVKLPTIWTDEKQRGEESEKSRQEERRRED
jgi:general stress protein 26